MLEDRLEIGIVGTHLLGGRHREHPFGQRLGRRIWATITARVP
jgi:hypothetical protein